MNNTQIIKKEANLAPANQLEFTEEQVELVRSLVAEKATPNELKLFLYQCKRTGLDPLTRQIYCIHRKAKKDGEFVERMTIQTSIDGFRVIAERSGKYGGQDRPNFLHNDQGQLIGCEITVYKFNDRGERYPAAVGVAYWSEYAQDSPMWKKMPHTMISKVAEALALRKAFPQDLSGLYTEEEMDQANKGDEVTGFNYSMFLQDYLSDLLETSTYDSGSEAYKQLEAAINDVDKMTEARYRKIRDGLKANQISREDKATMNVTDATLATRKRMQRDEDKEEVAA
jgi:phage recombination protein Bet